MKKKKITKRSIHHKSRHIVRRHKSTRDYNWVIYVGSCVALLMLVSVVVGVSNRRTLRQAVAGMSVANGLFAQATIPLPAIPSATAYNMYYWEQLKPGFTNTARNIPTNISSYTVSYLTKNKAYQYRISALDDSGGEFWWSPVMQMTNIISM